MPPREQERFDRLLQRVLDELPAPVRHVIDEVPVIVMDRPDEDLAAQLRASGLIDPEAEAGDDVMGLHSGVAITEASVQDSAVLPPQIHVFREALVEFAGGWDQDDADGAILDELRITLLHEIGHHFGLDEDDLDRLGYA